jgi:hypothetical protein
MGLYDMFMQTLLFGNMLPESIRSGFVRPGKAGGKIARQEGMNPSPTPRRPDRCRGGIHSRPDVSRTDAGVRQAILSDPG